MKLRLCASVVNAMLLAATMLSAAQSNAPPQATAPVPPTSGFRAEFLNELKYEEDRFIRLAQAVPADKYTWRPAEGVRSVSEVYDLEKQLDWLEGKKNTYRGVMIFVLRHAAEHLGQSIAYARANGIVPPWTSELQQQQQQKARH